MPNRETVQSLVCSHCESDLASAFGRDVERLADLAALVGDGAGIRVRIPFTCPQCGGDLELFIGTSEPTHGVTVWIARRT